MIRKGFLTVCLISSIHLYSGIWNQLGLENQKIKTVAVHPYNNQILLAGGNSVYKSVDGGITWDTVSSAYSANFIKFHPADPDTVYFTFGDGSYSDGIYRSTDCGNTWDVLFWMFYANSIAIPTSPPGVILIGSKGNGVYRSEDSGNNWDVMNDSLFDLDVLSLIAINPHDSIPLYIAGTDSGIYRYTDGYWHKTNAPDLPVMSFAIYRDEYPVILAAIDGGSWSDGIYRSDDYGETWSVIMWWAFIRDVLFNPLDSSIIYASDSGYGATISRDDGYTWNEINENLQDSVIHCLDISPADTTLLFAGAQHGVFVYSLGTGIRHDEDKKSDLVNVKNPAFSAPEITLNIPPFMLDKEVTVRIYDISGRLLYLLFKGKLKTTSKNLKWKHKESSGLLLVNVKIGEISITKKVIYIK